MSLWHKKELTTTSVFSKHSFYNAHIFTFSTFISNLYAAWVYPKFSFYRLVTFLFGKSIFSFSKSRLRCIRICFVFNCFKYTFTIYIFSGYLYFMITLFLFYDYASPIPLVKYLIPTEKILFFNVHKYHNSRNLNNIFSFYTFQCLIQYFEIYFI